MPYVRVVRWLLFPLLLLSIGAAAQVPDTAALRVPWRAHHDELTLLAGYHQGRHGFAVLGIGRNLYTHRHIPIGAGYFAGVEFRPDRPEVMGVKVGAYMNAMVSLGVQLITYPDPKAGGTVIRPEIGFGAMKVKLTYAYNVAFGSVEVPGVNTHMVSLTYAFRLLRLPGDDLHRPRR